MLFFPHSQDDNARQYDSCPKTARYKAQSRKKGFTLVELLVVLTILGILVMLAAPTFSDMLKRQEADFTVSKVRLVLLEARMTALTHHQHVVVCPTMDKQICNKSSSSVMSFMDTNANQIRDAGETLINYLPMSLSYGELRFNVGARRRYIRFFPDTGKPRGYFSNITYCPDNRDMTFAKATILNEHGVARISDDKNKDGIDERGGGRALSC